MLKYADILKYADPRNKGINSKEYKSTGVDPLLANTREAKKQRARAFFEKESDKARRTARTAVTPWVDADPVVREGVAGKVHEGFWSLLPGIGTHLATLPEYAYRLGNFHKRMYNMNKQPDENAWEALWRIWGETGEAMREDPNRKYLAYSGDAARRHIYQPARRFLHNTNPNKMQVEEFQRLYPEAAELAEFGGNALGWAALPGIGKTMASGLEHAPGPVGTAAPAVSKGVGSLYSAMGADAGVFDAANVAKAVGALPPDVADKAAWGASAAKQAVDTAVKLSK